ncbi:hypothetical protein [Polaromonas sp.]|uniref:hypothetical protein n=1 Tax=Polaromonas sp. TaxID=1869339 RepID=UPI003CB394EB
MDEDQYIREINKSTLDDVAGAVNDEEVGGTEFVRSTVEWYDNAFVNLALFRYLDPPGTLVSGPVQLVAYGAAAPPGSTRVWGGVVVVDGVNQAVEMYREGGAA